MSSAKKSKPDSPPKTNGGNSTPNGEIPPEQPLTFPDALFRISNYHREIENLFIQMGESLKMYTEQIEVLKRALAQSQPVTPPQNTPKVQKKSNNKK